MRKYSFFILFTFFSNISFSQNLVPDGSFEQDTACPLSGNVNYNTYWINPTAATPDYFDTCSSSTYLNDVPDNYAGSQNAYSGGAYIGVITRISSDFKEYVQVRLLDSLQAGSTYCVSYYVNLAGRSGYATNAPQLYFSDSAISSTGSSYFPYTPQINPASIITDSTNWTLISGVYSANGGEKYITIGNFFSDANTPSFWIYIANGIIAYYYVDNVSVINCDSLNSVNDFNSGSEIKLYPNPSSNKFYLSEISRGEIEIYNTLGKRVFVSEIKNNNQEIDFSDQPKGIYFVKLVTGEGIYSQKLIIQ